MTEEVILKLIVVCGLICFCIFTYVTFKLRKGIWGKYVETDERCESVVLPAELVEGDWDEEQYIPGDAVGEVDPDPDKEATAKESFREPPLTVADVRSVLEKLILLENRIGSNLVQHVNPSALPVDVDADAFANAVAKVMGIADRTYQISWEVMGDNVGGYVKSNEYDGQTVPIHLNISQATRKLERNTIICHEMAHVFLRRMLISLPDTHENECLTDLTPVYLGLGPIMLNGCMSVCVGSTFSMGGMEYGHSGTKGQTCYLTPSQLALACDIVARMRGQRLSLRLFDKKARATIRKSRREARALGLRYTVKPRAVVKDIESLESAFGELKHCVAYLEPRFSDALRKLVASADEISVTLRRILAEASDRAGGGGPVMALQRSLDAIIFRDADEKLSGRLIAAKKCMKSFGRAYHVLRKFDFIDDAVGCSDFSIVHCPKCDSKLRLPAGHSGNVRCPRCSHVFASATTVPEVFATETNDE